jgi:hypothetical protein
MTEGVFPTLLHQDPRYFRREKGSTLSRLGYAMGQIFWTHSDTGVTQFNYSEVIGNSTAVAISNAYYRDNRNVSDAVRNLACSWVWTWRQICSRSSGLICSESFGTCIARMPMRSDESSIESACRPSS